MPFAIDTCGGRAEILSTFRRHYNALDHMEADIDNGAPVQCLKAIERVKKRADAF